MTPAVHGRGPAPTRPPRPSVDEMATQMLTTTNERRGHAQELAVAVGQLMGVGMSDVGTSMAKMRRHGTLFEQTARSVLIEERFDRIPPNPDREGGGRPHRHRTFPCAWWLRGCKCEDCTRKVDRAHIEAMERECRICDTTTGELVWPDPKVGDRDRHGRTVVQVGPDGQLLWDRMAPPAPPPRDPGRAQWV